ncbi:MAG TPA: aromatic amino acid ammonia-lyase [Thermoleophilaceae bacterium]|nr:aromatic amino acid ammonia-lyase [Thermoleophilaceae bacterium]
MDDGKTVILDGRSLTFQAVEAVARDGARVRLDDAAVERNAMAARALGELLERGEPVYGVTTGVGPFRTRQVVPGERGDQQLRLLRSHAAGGGRLLPRELVRAAMAVRANQLGAGGAGVSVSLLDALVTALNDDFVPAAHEIGSLGTGDLTILAELALALIDAYSLELGPRDGIGFMSSNAASIGHAALVAASARRLLDGSGLVAALSFLAAAADPIVLDARVHEARPHPGPAKVAAWMRELLGEDSARAVAEARADSPIQDPYPFRALPQVAGATRDALEALERVLAVELNSASENALIDAAEPAVLPNANFHAGGLAIALDGLRAALAQSSSLGAARVTSLLDPSLTGLPRMLASDTGSGSGAMMLEYTAHAAAAEVRVLAAPVTAQTTAVGGSVESHASFALLAARMAEQAVEAAAVATAAELVVAVRGLRMRGVHPSGIPVADMYERAAAVLDPDMADRPLSEDLDAAERLLFEETR